MSQRPVIFYPEAEDDLDDAIAWYSLIDQKLGRDFWEKVNTAIERIGSFPEISPIYVEDARRVKTARFPYQIVYRVENDTIVIVSIVHAKRHPREFLRRL